ncbi:MAG: type II toxin-antitoxin system HicA family toxin [Candidatus Thiodiazotropha endolucinida]
MSKHEKLLEELCRRPKDFTWNSAVSLLRHYGFKRLNRKTGGSHRTFYCEERDIIFKISEPHPGNELKMYQVDDLLDVLVRVGAITDETDD